MKSFAFLAAAMLATTAMPAAAKPITYTLSGVFGGTIAGNPFNIAAVFTGKGDTSSATGAFGNPQSVILGVPLTSISALAGGQTFTITTPATFIKYSESLFNSGNGDRLGFSFDQSGVNGLGLESPAFNGYDGLSSFAQTPGATYFQNASFNTNQGAVVINSFTGGSFGATAVPEPATWAFMIVGFGAIGGAMRRRNRNVTTAVSFA